MLNAKWVILESLSNFMILVKTKNKKQSWLFFILSLGITYSNTQLLFLWSMLRKESKAHIKIHIWDVAEIAQQGKMLADKPANRSLSLGKESVCFWKLSPDFHMHTIAHRFIPTPSTCSHKHVHARKHTHKHTRQRHMRLYGSGHPGLHCKFHPARAT